MKKRILFSTILLLLAFCLVFVSCEKKNEPQKDPNGSDQTASEGLQFVSNGDGTCYLFGIGTCTDDKIVVPATSPDGDRVTAIGNGPIDEENCSGFFLCTGVKSVVLPDGITSIAEAAFAGCTSLNSLTLPSSVASIGTYAFYGCVSLETLAIPDSVTSIGIAAFDSCTLLKSVTLPRNLISVSDALFQRCTSLESVTIPVGTTSIKQYAFAGCTALQSLNLPGTLKSIEQYAFVNCTLLYNITLPSSVASIGDMIFAYCDSLSEITYQGTLVEWNAITKSENWDASTGKYVVHCLDGNYEKPLAEVTVPVADELYTEADSSSDYVKMNVSFTDANGNPRTGDIVIQLRPDCAPLTVANFKKLVSEGYYDGTEFFRIVNGLMIQGGENEEKEADYVKGEFSANGVENPLSHVRGTISMARRAIDYDGVSAYDSASAGFFIVQKDYTSWDGEYATFGTVVFGIENVDNIAGQDLVYSEKYYDTVYPKYPVTINSVTFVTPID